MVEQWKSVGGTVWCGNGLTVEQWNGVRGRVVVEQWNNLYVNDLPSAFQNTLSDPIILPNGTKLNSLLYADDLIIISRSKIGLQNCLNTLSSFCNSWMLDINSKKTKVMIFQKRAKKNSNLEFHIGNETIDIVHEYLAEFLKTYLKTGQNILTGTWR